MANRSPNEEMPEVKKTDEETLMTDYNSQAAAVLFYVLRGITNEKNALTAPKLASLMSHYLVNISSKTVQRTIQKLLAFQNWEKEEGQKRSQKKFLADVLYSVYGGRIAVTGNKTPKYYFEPCMDDACMRMLNGTVLSNRFLSYEEKKYLLSRMQRMNMLEAPIDDPEDKEEEEEQTEGVPEEDDPDFVPFPGEGNLFLRNIVRLNSAITNERIVAFTYGTYDMAGEAIDYHARTEKGEEKKYVINPYAMFWNNGHYYLLATYVKGYEPSYMNGKKQLVHFRVDRIIELRIFDAKHKREDIPPSLEKYYRLVEEGKKFDEELYTRSFPYMRISREAKLITCVIECTPWSLQVLVDAFGTMFQVKESRKKHGEDELDYNAREQVFLEAHIKDVDFENARDFCLANPEYLTPIEPAELVDAVKEKLEYSLNKYQANLHR